MGHYTAAGRGTSRDNGIRMGLGYKLLNIMLIRYYRSDWSGDTADE